MSDQFTILRAQFVELMGQMAEQGADIIDIHAAVASAELDARVNLWRTLDKRQQKGIQDALPTM